MKGLHEYAVVVSIRSCSIGSKIVVEEDIPWTNSPATIVKRESSQYPSSYQSSDFFRNNIIIRSYQRCPPILVSFTLFEERIKRSETEKRYDLINQVIQSINVIRAMCRRCLYESHTQLLLSKSINQSFIHHL